MFMAQAIVQLITPHIFEMELCVQTRPRNFHHNEIYLMLQRKRKNIIQPNPHSFPQALHSFRTDLTLKLDFISKLRRTGSPPICAPHQANFAFYNPKASRFLCAICLKDKNKKDPKILSHILPIDDVEAQLKAEVSLMKEKIEAEVQVLETIEETLYEGFENEKIELSSKLKEIELIYYNLALRVKEEAEKSKQLLLEKYREEKQKHELVLKQIGLIRTVSSEYYSQLTQVPPTLLNPTKKQTVFAHLIATELYNGLKFSDNGLKWDASTHQNYVKNVGRAEVEKAKKMWKVWKEKEQYKQKGKYKQKEEYKQQEKERK